MDQKWILKSKTIWGAIIGFLPHLLVLAGVAPEPGSIEALDVAGSSVLDALWVLFNSLNELLGAVLVLWGRVTAKTQLKVV